MRALARLEIGSAVALAAAARGAAFAPLAASIPRVGSLGQGVFRSLAVRGASRGGAFGGVGARALSLSSQPEQVPAHTREPPMKVLYDGKCPLCLAEISFLEKRSTKHGYSDKICFVDVAEGDYNSAHNGGVSYDDAMRVMTVVRGDGSVSKGMAAFEDIYAQVGLPWVFAMLKYPRVRRFADSVYDFWAVYRLPISGRGSLDAHLAQRMKDARCDSGACEAKRGA